jgi:hypothetical protein
VLGPGRSYIFVDNTNVFIEGQRAAAAIKGREWAQRYRLDFGALFRHLTPGGGSVFFVDAGEPFPKLYGSEPPRLDALWRQLEDMGVGVKIHQRSFFGKEKRVDTHLCIDVSRLIYKNKPKPDGEIVIVAGDGDYLDLIGELRNLSWPFRVAFWAVKGVMGGAAKEIRNLPEFNDLAPHLDEPPRFMPERFPHPYGERDWSKEVLYHETERAPKRREHRID